MLRQSDELYDKRPLLSNEHHLLLTQTRVFLKSSFSVLYFAIRNSPNTMDAVTDFLYVCVCVVIQSVMFVIIPNQNCIGQAMLQLYLSDQQFFCLLQCYLYYRLDGILGLDASFSQMDANNLKSALAQVMG